jgi:hypothetical protein
MMALGTGVHGIRMLIVRTKLIRHGVEIMTFYELFFLFHAMFSDVIPITTTTP